jgi:ethanolamine utilization protein EutQ (cupin superfamily)
LNDRITDLKPSFNEHSVIRKCVVEGEFEISIDEKEQILKPGDTFLPYQT